MCYSNRYKNNGYYGIVLYSGLFYYKMKLPLLVNNDIILVNNIPGNTAEVITACYGKQAYLNKHATI